MSGKKQSEIEQGLQERIGQLVNEALAVGNKPRTLSAIEDIALAVRAKIGEEVTQALVNQQAPVEVPGPKCQQCGREMHFKGLKKRKMVTRSGEVEWERPYYYCGACQRGLFPPR
jgi:hypothetical protein